MCGKNRPPSTSVHYMFDKEITQQAGWASSYIIIVTKAESNHFFYFAKLSGELSSIGGLKCKWAHVGVGCM